MNKNNKKRFTIKRTEKNVFIAELIAFIITCIFGIITIICWTKELLILTVINFILFMFFAFCFNALFDLSEEWFYNEEE